MAKHTAGPWHRNIKPARKYVTVWSGRNTHVAHITPSPDMSDEELEANIDLIAAAPELLVCAKAFLRVIEATSLPDDGLTRAFRAAIAKAEGRSAQ